MAQDSEETPKSFGPMGPAHWSRARAGMNAEALEYYRSRESAPGVAAGGAERNFYCMQCDGVIPHDHASGVCPHCGASLAGLSRRYFNWVEINESPTGDARAVAKLAAWGLGALAVAGGVAWWLVTRGAP